MVSKGGAAYGAGMTALPATPTTNPEPTDDALTGLTATEMARLVRDRELDPLDLVEAHLKRIEAREPELHAFAAVLATSARSEAVRLRSRADLASLPLAGVPVAIKDNVDIAGEPTTLGSAATPRTPAGADHVIVRRLRDAGAIVIGRTVMPELAIWPFTEPAAYPAPRNPWDTTRTPGGSSGGSAVAVAARMAAIAVGSDGGGSIRVPAACCGLVGVKPSPGVVPVAGGHDGDHWYGMTAFGPIARDVADAGLVLDVIAGTAEYRDPVAPRERLRIAVAARHPVVGARLSKDCRAALDTVATTLEQAGHVIRRERPPYPLTPTQFTDRWLAGIAQDADGLDLSKVEPRTRAMVRRGIKVQRKVRPASESRFANAMRGWFPRCDVLITPVLASTPVPIGTWAGRGWVSTMLGIARWMGYTSLWNVAGAAAIAVPAGVSGDGLPLSVQLIGPAGSERLLLSLAEQVQQLRPWPAPPNVG
jgi:amidase